jgi:hypothetical protein
LDFWVRSLHHNQGAGHYIFFSIFSFINAVLQKFPLQKVTELYVSYSH